jgi:hypothetical protein
MMVLTEASEEREALDLELQNELERVFEAYLRAPESEKQKAKVELIAKLRECNGPQNLDTKMAFS